MHVYLTYSRGKIMKRSIKEIVAEKKMIRTYLAKAEAAAKLKQEQDAIKHQNKIKTVEGRTFARTSNKTSSHDVQNDQNKKAHQTRAALFAKVRHAADVEAADGRDDGLGSMLQFYANKQQVVDQTSEEASSVALEASPVVLKEETKAEAYAARMARKEGKRIEKQEVRAELKQEGFAPLRETKKKATKAEVVVATSTDLAEEAQRLRSQADSLVMLGKDAAIAAEKRAHKAAVKAGLDFIEPLETEQLEQLVAERGVPRTEADIVREPAQKSTAQRKLENKLQTAEQKQIIGETIKASRQARQEAKQEAKSEKRRAKRLAARLKKQEAIRSRNEMLGIFAAALVVAAAVFTVTWFFPPAALVIAGLALSTPALIAILTVASAGVVTALGFIIQAIVKAVEANKKPVDTKETKEEETKEADYDADDEAEADVDADEEQPVSADDAAPEEESQTADESLVDSNPFRPSSTGASFFSGNTDAEEGVYIEPMQQPGSTQ
jgi:hypothetical protein